jgi:Ca-activated chloride channel family protein
MMEYVHAFHFLRPWWLMCILVLPVLPRLLRRTDGSASLERLVDAPLLPHLIKGSGTTRLGPVIGIMLAWVLACMALAGPTWERLPQPVYTAQRAQVIAVSLSRRMLATDMLPNRMTRVRYKIHALLKANKDGQNALVAYAGAAFTVAPLTSDAGALTDLLDALSPDTMPVQGDNASAGIRRATRLLEEAGIKQGSIVLIDDHADQDAVRAARAAKAAGMRVSVLGVGTQKGAPVARPGGGFEKGPDGKVVMAARDDASLRAVASAGGGLYVHMQPDSKDVDALTSQLRTGAASRDSRQKVQVWRDQGPWLLLLVLPLAALAFRRGVLFLLPFIVLAPLFSAPAHAGGWSDAWRTRDQQAARAH